MSQLSTSRFKVSSSTISDASQVNPSLIKESLLELQEGLDELGVLGELSSKSQVTPMSTLALLTSCARKVL